MLHLLSQATQPVVVQSSDPLGAIAQICIGLASLAGFIMGILNRLDHNKSVQSNATVSAAVNKVEGGLAATQAALSNVAATVTAHDGQLTAVAQQIGTVAGAATAAVKSTLAGKTLT